MTLDLGSRGAAVSASCYVATGLEGRAGVLVHVAADLGLALPSRGTQPRRCGVFGRVGGHVEQVLVLGRVGCRGQTGAGVLLAVVPPTRCGGAAF